MVILIFLSITLFLAFDVAIGYALSFKKQLRRANRTIDDYKLDIKKEVSIADDKDKSAKYWIAQYQAKEKEYQELSENFTRLKEKEKDFDELIKLYGELNKFVDKMKADIESGKLTADSFKQHIER
jgi:hypothetical protein